RTRTRTRTRMRTPSRGVPLRYAPRRRLPRRLRLRPRQAWRGRSPSRLPGPISRCVARSGSCVIVMLTSSPSRSRPSSPPSSCSPRAGRGGARGPSPPTPTRPHRLRRRRPRAGELRAGPLSVPATRPAPRAPPLAPEVAALRGLGRATRTPWPTSATRTRSRSSPFALSERCKSRAGASSTGSSRTSTSRSASSLAPRTTREAKGGSRGPTGPTQRMRAGTTTS
ncbi:hypothetical protein VTO73DRAFT_12862, partial [Trametes versicolor]